MSSTETELPPNFQFHDGGLFVRTPDLIYSEGEMSTRYIDPDKMIVEDLKLLVIEPFVSLHVEHADNENYGNISNVVAAQSEVSSHVLERGGIYKLEEGRITSEGARVADELGDEYERSNKRTDNQTTPHRHFLCLSQGGESGNSDMVLFSATLTIAELPHSGYSQGQAKSSGSGNTSSKAQRDGNGPTASQIYKQLHTRKEGLEMLRAAGPGTGRVADLADIIFPFAITYTVHHSGAPVVTLVATSKENAAQLGAKVDDDALFLQAARRVNKKGTVYALGNGSEAYYEQHTPARQSLRTTSYTPSVISQMEARLKKAEEELHVARGSLRKLEEEVHATREELKSTSEKLGRRIASLEALIKASSSHHTPLPCT
ncbi:hypothetical protein Cgig2_011074 [Carnegiea gigantea]|uniref:Uncharacterized protein n=1 Tax=Carnegiea gigantea TaxID=171969 RepID=A0A9Q1JSB2_9CARY|nr:hypothetical protein Cgig2_011074 [Carnegiea gigantea]